MNHTSKIGSCGKGEFLELKANCLLRMCKWSILNKEGFFPYSMTSELCNWINQRCCTLMMTKIPGSKRWIRVVWGRKAASEVAERDWCSSTCPLGHWPPHRSGLAGSLCAPHCVICLLSSLLENCTSKRICKSLSY